MMLHAVDKKRLAQAIESYNVYDKHRWDSDVEDTLWEKFYAQARFCCHGDNTNIASLIYNCHDSKRDVETIYHAIVFMGYNIDYCTDEHKGDEWYEQM